MLRYLIRRLLWFVPTLIVITIVTFGLSKRTPGDPVAVFLDNVSRLESDPVAYRKAYFDVAKSLGLDKPAFYFTLTTSAYPRDLYQEVSRDRRECLRSLIAQYGNWPQIRNYYQQIGALDTRLSASTTGQAATTARATLRLLYLQDKDEVIRINLDTIRNAIGADSLLHSQAFASFDSLSKAYDQITTKATPGKHYIPAFYWHGFDNQYHNWLKRVLVGDFGRSYANRQPVADRLLMALRWTLVINSIAILLAYLIAVPLGVYTAIHRGKRQDSWITTVLFMLHSLPVFWVATLLLIFFTTPEYGMDWFPTMGVGEPGAGASFFERLFIRVSHLALPVFCLTYGALAFIARQMRGSMTEALQLDFVRTARAKGLTERQVIWKHAFRNALSPIITMLGSVLPAAIAGSVVIEVIFNIPGMGKLSVDAINSKDWPVVYGVLILSAIVTMAGILLADMLYALADPRVKLDKKQ